MPDRETYGKTVNKTRPERSLSLSRICEDHSADEVQFRGTTSDKPSQPRGGATQLAGPISEAYASFVFIALIVVHNTTNTLRNI